MMEGIKRKLGLALWVPYIDRGQQILLLENSFFELDYFKRVKRSFAFIVFPNMMGQVYLLKVF